MREKKGVCMRACCVYKVYTGIFRARGAPRLDSPALACAPLRIYMYITPRRVLLELSFFLLLSSLFLSFVSFSFSLSLLPLSLPSLAPSSLSLSLPPIYPPRQVPSNIYTRSRTHTSSERPPGQGGKRETDRRTQLHASSFSSLSPSLSRISRVLKGSTWTFQARISASRGVKTDVSLCSEDAAFVSVDNTSAECVLAFRRGRSHRFLLPLFLKV